MFRKVSIPVCPSQLLIVDLIKALTVLKISGLILNTSYFLCPSCDTPHQLFGSSENFLRTAREVGVPVLGELPLVQSVNAGGDAGVPFMLTASTHSDRASKEWQSTMVDVASKLWDSLTINDK
jgi:ATP-binding protein involved in chromosome partitioning